MRFGKLLVLAVVAFGLAFVGCKKEEEKKAEQKAEQVVKKAEEAKAEKAPEPAKEEPKVEEKKEEPKVEEKKEEPKVEEKKEEPPPAPAVGQAAKETVETALKAVQSKNLLPIVDLVPAPYLADLDGVVHAFAEAMDKELFDKTVALIDRTIAVAKAQKDPLAKMVVGMGIPAKEEDIAKGIEVAAEIWAAMKEMGLTNLDTLKTLSVATFAKEQFPKIADKIWAFADATQKAQLDAGLAMLAAAKVDVVGETDDPKWGKVVELNIGIGGDAEKGKMVAVEGKWVPIDLAEEWAEGMKEAHEGIAEMKTELPNAKAQIMTQLAEVEKMVEQVEKTGDLSVLQSLGGMMMGMPAAPATDAAVPAPTEGAPAPAEGAAPAPAEGAAPAPAEAAPAPAPAEAAPAPAPANP